MLNSLFGSVISTGGITASAFFLCTFTALVIGLAIAVVYSRTQSCTKSFAITLALLPAIVGIVIMMVNGNIGAGVAVAGAFSLVRFRSAQGTGQEILLVFLAMAVGLATGMGYLAVAVLFTLIIILVFLLLSGSSIAKRSPQEQALKITVPETLDFEGVFDDILKKYTDKAELEEVKTTGMGSLYRLSYKVVLKQGISTKQMIDEIRTRNGNLEVSCGRQVFSNIETL